MVRRAGRAVSFWVAGLQAQSERAAALENRALGLIVTQNAGPTPQSYPTLTHAALFPWGKYFERQ